MPSLWSLPLADSLWGWGLFLTLGTENLESIKKHDIRKYEKVLCFVNDHIKLLGEAGLLEAADPGFLARKDKSAFSLALAKTWAAFLPCLQWHKRQQPKQQQQHSSALDPWQSWCLHGSDGRRNIYIGHQVDWLLGKKEEEFLVKYFDRHCWIAAQKPLPPSLILLYRLRWQNNDVPSLSCSKKWPCDTVLTTRIWSGRRWVSSRKAFTWLTRVSKMPPCWIRWEVWNCRGQKAHTLKMAEWKDRRSLDLENIASPLNKLYTAFFWTSCYPKENKLYLKSKWYNTLFLYKETVFFRISRVHIFYLPGYKRKSVLLCSNFSSYSFTSNKISQQPPRAPAGVSAPLKSFLVTLVKLFSSFSRGSEPRGIFTPPSHPLEPTWPILWVPTAVL